MSYPIMLNIEGRQAVVIGGGKIAERKIVGLLQAGALVTVIAPSITAKLQSFVESEQLRWCNRCFETTDVMNAFIVVAATNNSKVNLAVYEAAKDKLINIVDRPNLCSFQLPAVFEQGRLTVAISTGGSSPALAKTIKQKLADVFDDSYREYLDFLAMTRPVVLEKIKNESTRKTLFRTLASEQFFIGGNWEAAFQKLLEESLNEKD